MKGKYQAVALALLAALTLAACSAAGGNQMHAGAPMHPAASAAPRWTLVALGTCPSRWASQSSGRGKPITRRSGMIHCRSEVRYPTRGLRTAGGLVSKHSMMPAAVRQRVHLRVKSPVPRLFEQQRLPLAVWFGDELHLASPLNHRRGRVDPARLEFTPGAVQDMRSASNG